jgi:putative hydrolase of the HAD superfamily
MVNLGRSSALGVDAVVFDLGGVLADSPFDAISRLEARLGMEESSINSAIVGSGSTGAFARLERGEIDAQGFPPAFEADLQRVGVAGDAASEAASCFLPDVMQNLQLRPDMLVAIKRLRDAGVTTAVLTNNFRVWSEPSTDKDGSVPLDPVLLEACQGLGPSLTAALCGSVDCVVQSCLEGMRKPDPRIYDATHARLERLRGLSARIEAGRVVFLDDIGRNLKPARARGWRTIRVGRGRAGVLQALTELQAIAGMRLLGQGALLRPARL